MRIRALTCSVLQHSKIWTQNPLSLLRFPCRSERDSDLRNLGEGTYDLATTHEGDAASYFYPLTLQ